VEEAMVEVVIVIAEILAQQIIVILIILGVMLVIIPIMAILATMITIIIIMIIIINLIQNFSKEIKLLGQKENMDTPILINLLYGMRIIMVVQMILLQK
jgi:hypothetical protein